MAIQDSIGSSDDIEEIPAEDENNSSTKALYEKIIKRCKDSDIEYSYENFEDDFYLIINIPAGRNTVRFPIFNSSSAEEFLNIDFEKYTFLEPYESLVDYKAGTVEVGVRSTGLARSSRILEELADGEGIKFESENPNLPKIVLGSGLIDGHSQNMTVAARAMAEKKAFGHLS